MELPPHGLPYLYSFVSCSTAEIILRDRMCRFSHPSLFNDLLDAQHIVRNPLSDLPTMTLLREEYFRLTYCTPPARQRAGSVGQTLVALFRAAAAHRTPDEVRAFIADAFARSTPNEDLWRRVVGNPEEPIEKAMRILCLTSDPRSLPMWYHYGARYEGVAIAYDCQSASDTMFAIAKPMVYSDDIPLAMSSEDWVQLATGQVDTPRDALTARYFTKSREWQYEHEYRIAIVSRDEDKYHYTKMVTQEFGGLVFGTRTTEEWRAKLTKAARDWRADCRLWKASLNRERFGFELTEI